MVVVGKRFPVGHSLVLAYSRTADNEQNLEGLLAGEGDRDRGSLGEPKSSIRLG